MGQKRMFFRGLRTSLCGASSLLRCLYHLDQSRHFVLGWSIEAAIPLCLGEFPSEIDFNSKVWFPAGDNAPTREVVSLSLAVSKGYLPPQLGTSNF